MSRSYVLRIADMIECCERVLRYTNGASLPQLLADSRTLDNETLWGVITGKVPSLLVALRALWASEGNEGAS